jgi:predicted DNA-binding antitoxin AbrB/MazE fold protein
MRAEMAITVEATYENGVLKPHAPLQLEEKSKVTVTIETAEPTPLDADDPTGWKAIDRLVGSVKSGLKDVSENHDDYLYGNSRD